MEDERKEGGTEEEGDMVEGRVVGERLNKPHHETTGDQPLYKQPIQTYITLHHWLQQLISAAYNPLLRATLPLTLHVSTLCLWPEKAVVTRVDIVPDTNGDAGHTHYSRQGSKVPPLPSSVLWDSIQSGVHCNSATGGLGEWLYTVQVYHWLPHRKAGL